MGAEGRGTRIRAEGRRSQTPQKVKQTFERMKIALHKGFYYYFHVIYFWSLFALLFKKLKKCRDFLKKIRVSSPRKFSHWSLSSVCCKLNFIEELLF